MEQINELNNVRKLATIARILDIQPIEGADNIETVFVRGWRCVAKKGEYAIGDLCIYVEVDSVMPDGLDPIKAEEWRALQKQMSKVSTESEKLQIKQQMEDISKLNTRPEFEFLRSSKFRIKTKRIFDSISQGICFPLSILESVGKFQSVIGDSRWDCLLLLTELKFLPIPIVEDEDLTEILGVTQYVAPDPATMGGDAKGDLQNVGVLISDEERLENLSSKYEILKQFKYFKTEKMEGTSVTFYIKDGVFGVCGRTIEFKIPEETTPINELNVYWKMAKKYDIEKKMRSYFESSKMNIAFQGEIVGEGIQGNIYKLKGQEVCLYNAFDIIEQQYLPYETFLELTKELDIPTVPILDDNYTLPENSIDLLLEADKTTTVFGNNPNQLIEGFVYVAKQFTKGTKVTRSGFGRLSFKAKSRTYDLNKNK